MTCWEKILRNDPELLEFFGNLYLGGFQVRWQTSGQKLNNLSRTFRSLSKPKVGSIYLNHPVDSQNILPQFEELETTGLIFAADFFAAEVAAPL